MAANLSRDLPLRSLAESAAELSAPFVPLGCLRAFRLNQPPTAARSRVVKPAGFPFSNALRLF